MSAPEVSHGRGGAGNITPDDTKYTDAGIVRAGEEGTAVSTGRGGMLKTGLSKQDLFQLPPSLLFPLFFPPPSFLSYSSSPSSVLCRLFTNRLFPQAPQTSSTRTPRRRGPMRTWCRPRRCGRRWRTPSTTLGGAGPGTSTMRLGRGPATGTRTPPLPGAITRRAPRGWLISSRPR